MSDALFTLKDLNVHMILSRLFTGCQEHLLYLTLKYIFTCINVGSIRHNVAGNSKQ